MPDVCGANLHCLAINKACLDQWEYLVHTHMQWLFKTRGHPQALNIHPYKTICDKTLQTYPVRNIQLYKFL